MKQHSVRFDFRDQYGTTVHSVQVEIPAGAIPRLLSDDCRIVGKIEATLVYSESFGELTLPAGAPI